ncbi:hypothetical protein E8E14_009572 [Neopestalotiopsis sp. 37M]|nr:hypothetical protein E8E14_009572 [Neopestalotiopsis sp. 37M]
MHQYSLYSYQPIRHDQIRLLKFLEDGDQPSAVLQTFSVEEPLPYYHTLSYTWACDKNSLARSWALQIENKQLPVLDSLNPFVSALTRKEILLDGTWWWIDSICIDQSNLGERAEQVQLMQLIYQKANNVIVWLGDESIDSDLAVDFIEHLDRIKRKTYTAAEVRLELPQDQFRSHWIALANFLGRKWWTRIWTVQEFVIPSSISFWCGIREVDRTYICNSLSVADKCTSSGFKETIAFRCGFNRKRAWEIYKYSQHNRRNSGLSLLALAGYFCFMDATEERDRLYGLMALSSDSFLLRVNYSISNPEVYMRFAQTFISHHKSLDIICFASIYSPPAGSSRPSWVPVWQKMDAFLVVPLMVSQSAKAYVGNMRSPTFLKLDECVISYSAARDSAAVYEFSGSELLARGIIVDVVDGLAASGDRELVQGSTPISMEQLTEENGYSDFPYSPMATLASVCRSLVLGRGDRYLRYAMPTEDFLRDFIGLCAPLLRTTQSEPPKAPKELQEWFEWTRSLCIRGYSLESILQRGIGQSNIGVPADPAPNQDEYISDSFFGRFFDTVVRMSLRLMSASLMDI